MKKEFRDTGQVQSMMFWGNCALAIEHQPVCQLHVMQNKWKNISKLAKHYISEKKDYRRIGKYRVKEIFDGEESLTSLLTQYVERTVAIRY